MFETTHNLEKQDGRPMSQAASRRSFIAEARVRGRINPCGICIRSGTGTNVSPSYSFTPVSIITPWLHTQHVGDVQTAFDSHGSPH
jgi:hypothetical protein